MKTLITQVIFILVVLVSSSFSEQGRWVIHPQSRLLIHGTTNVNSFKCMLDAYKTADTLEYTQEGSSIELNVSRNRMRIPIRSFDCGNKQITRDFWSTLQSEKHPDIEIHFRSFRNGRMSHNSHIHGIVDITLAGATKRYNVKYLAQVPNDGDIFLTGTQTVNFADFRLEPPQKMMGLIQVQECLEVEFKLRLKSI